MRFEKDKQFNSWSILLPLPAFQDNGWLPAGHHAATWNEVEVLFGGKPSSQRRLVLERLLAWRDEARQHGLTGRLILNGSFISQKVAPGDFDAIFVYDEATSELVKRDPEAQALINYSVCKTRFHSDIFVFAETTVQRFPHICSLDMFDYEKTTRVPKGVIEVTL